jgi:hypothetical protein
MNFKRLKLTTLIVGTYIRIGYKELVTKLIIQQTRLFMTTSWKPALRTKIFGECHSASDLPVPLPLLSLMFVLQSLSLSLQGWVMEIIQY